MSVCYCPNADNTAYNVCGAGSSPCGTDRPGYFNQTSGVQLCCAVDSGDECGANSICKYNHSAPGHPEGGSGFYFGGCTDPTFKDPLCRTDCEDRIHLPTEDIVYDFVEALWHCCGKNASGDVDCNQPVDELSFRAFAPNNWPGPVDAALTPAATVSSTITTTSPSASSSVLSPTSSSFASSPTPTNTAQSGALSSAAKAGLGVGVSVAGLLLIGLAIAVVIIWRRTSRRSNFKTKLEDTGKPEDDDNATNRSSKSLKIANGQEFYELETRVNELGPKDFFVELEAPLVRHEVS